MNEDTLKLNLSPIATEPYNVFNDAPKVKYLTSDDLQRQVRISPDWIENVGIKSTGAYKTPNRIADFGTSVAQGATQIPGRAVQVLVETAGNFLLNPESIPVVTPIGEKTLGSFIPESLTEKLAGYRYPWEPIARRLMTDSFENLQQRDLANELYAMQKGIDPEQWQNELGRALGESWLYAGQIAATSAIGAPQIGIGLTMAEMTGDYAHETASQYVERTGDKDFENFTSDDAKLSSALAYGAIGTAIEFTGGVEPLLMGSLKRVGLRSSVGKAILKTGAEEGLEEFAQGMLEQFLRSSDGTATQTWGEAFKESLKGAVYGAVIGGAIGGPAFYINRRNLVKGLRRAFPDATNANLTKIANTMIETAANQTHPDSRLIDNLKAKVRAMYADAEIVDDAIIDSTTNLEYSLISMDALERGIDIAEHPIFQGEVNELGWFRGGIPEHRRTEINKYIADINDLTNKIQAENAKETKDWDKIDELETKLEFLRSQSLDRLEGLVIADRAELRKMLQEQQDELTRRRMLRLTQEQARKAAQRQDVLDERASERERRAEEKRIARQNKIELQKALREIRAEQRAQALKNRLMDVARIEAASDESLRAVLIEAGYLKDVVDKLKPRTLRSQVKQLQDANLDLLQSESTRLNQETLNLADENARLDEVNPKYTGDTITIPVTPINYNNNIDLYSKKAKSEYESKKSRYDEKKNEREKVAEQIREQYTKIQDAVQAYVDKIPDGKLYTVSEMENLDFYPKDFIGFKTNKHKYYLPFDSIMGVGPFRWEPVMSKIDDSNVKTLMEELNSLQEKGKELSKDYVYRQENPTVLMIRDGYANSQNTINPFTDSEYDTRPYGYEESIMKTIRKELKKLGWKPYHSSGKRVASSSSYYEKDGKTIRLSDHELPDTPERRYKTEMGLRKGWDYELVLSESDMRDLAIQPTREQFISELYSQLGIDDIPIGIERTVYNSNGERIAKSEPALRNFYKWFGDSKVVDSQGRPLVVYHGTDAEFDTFDISKFGQTDSGEFGKGFYFTDSKNYAEEYGSIVMPVYLKITNAYTTKVGNNISEEKTERIKADGYDGIFVLSRPDEYKISNFDSREEYEAAVADISKSGKYIVETVWKGDDVDEKTFVYSRVEYVAFEPNQIKSVNNRGTFDAGTGNIYYQSAYAGSRVDYDRPSLEAIGSGEGNQAHGWGLYYALNPEIALGYMNRFTEYSNPLSFNGKQYEYGKDLEYVPLQELKSGEKTLEQLKIEYQENVQNLTQYAQEAKESNDAYWERQWTEQAQDTKNVSDFLNGLENITKDDIKIIGGQVHKVDIPEMDVLLDEQKLLKDQTPFVKRALKQVAKEAGIGLDLQHSNGKYVYDNIANAVGGPKQASELLEKYGIKGITYDGRQDGRCFVIFNPESVKVLRKKFDELGNVLFQTQNQTGIERSGPRGAYIPEYRFIQKAATMDASTLSHELAHDWMQENFRWLRSGKASPEFKEMWGGVERALGIRENELRVPKKASEEFARAYEGWILNRKDWTKGLNVDGSDRDKMVKAFESYQAKLRDIYDSLQNKYFKQTWGEYAQLKPEIESWFERQLNITDVDARERRGELTPAQANQERIDNAINQLIENGDKDIQGLKEIQTLNDTSRYEVPGGNKNSLQERLGILAKEIDENGMLVNPKYDTHRDMMKVAQDADTFVKTRQQDALDIINGIKPETDGLFASDLYTALERLAIENSDMNLLEELRTSEMANRIARELGQRVAGFRQMKADGVDVMSAIKSLDRQYAKIAERNNAQIEEALELYEQAINNQDAKEMKNLDKFLSELECK